LAIGKVVLILGVILFTFVVMVGGNPDVRIFFVAIGVQLS
jgi:hypothetical protein